ncbi:hypothetical protein QP231_23760, partial [Klebsiella pneumoniae]|nr:hypothetical protein [Klebsiella pneumoniae]
LMMSLWDALRMNMMISYQELVRTFPKNHWIVWDGPITTQYGEVISLTTKENELVQLKLFSWGKVKNQIKRHLALSDVMGSIFGGVVFKSLE